MIRGMYNSGMGLLSLQKQQETITNNLSNVRTPSYKSRELGLEASFPQMVSNHAGRGGRRNDLGTMYMGTSVTGLNPDHTQGELLETGNPLDLALEGEGFLQFATPEGTMLGRNGRLHRSAEGFLVDQNNNPVLGYGQQGELTEIAVSQGAELSVDSSGVISDHQGDLTELALVDVQDEALLEIEDYGYFNTDADNMLPAMEASVHQGYYENSNVDATDEMVKLMSNTRLMHSNQRVLTTIDETLGYAVNEVGKL